jgi:hypothetical protein
MWTEIILPRDELARLLDQVFPLTIRLGDSESDNSLSLSDLADVRLVPDLGLRVECKARVRWPVLGIELPLALNALTLLLVPSIGQGPHGDTLVFRISVEHADFTAVPDMIDQRITAAINAKLEAKGAELCWDLSKSLALSTVLPALLEDLAAFALRPRWAKVRITDQAVVYVASFNSAFVRQGAQVPDDLALCIGDDQRPAVTSSELPVRPSTIRPRVPNGSRGVQHLASAGMFGLGAGAAYFALRAATRALR